MRIFSVILLLGFGFGLTSSGLFAESAQLVVALNPTLAGLQASTNAAQLAATRSQGIAQALAADSAADPSNAGLLAASQIAAVHASVAAQRAQMLQAQLLSAQSAVAQVKAATAISEPLPLPGSIVGPYPPSP